MSKIIELTSENVKRLSAVHIKPDGNMVVIGGANGQGKSSVLDSIMYALAGTKAIPSKPLRKGQQAGKVLLKLDADPARMLPAMTVERTFTADGKTTLEITSDDGYRAPTPQTILNDICGRIAFDPLAFTRMKPKEQADTLRSVVGLDFSEQDRERKRLFDARAEVNRDGKQLRSRHDAIVIQDGTPDEEVDVDALLTELEAANENNAAVENKLRVVNAATAARQSQAESIEAMRTKLAEAEKNLTRLVTAEKNAQDVFAAAKLIDITPTKTKLAAAAEINQSVQRKREKAAMETELQKLRDQSQGLTDDIAAIDAAKTLAMSEAKWPVEGLGFSDEGVTLNELPFEQASSAEQLRVSVAMGLAMNPGLRVLLIRDGSLLDEQSLALLALLAEEQSAQLWVERVGRDQHCSVVIVDGAVEGVVAEVAEEAAVA